MNINKETIVNINKVQAFFISNKISHLQEDFKKLANSLYSESSKNANKMALEPLFSFIEKKSPELFQLIKEKIDSHLFVLDLKKVTGQKDIYNNNLFYPVIMVGEITINLRYRVLEKPNSIRLDDATILSVTGAGKYEDVIIAGLLSNLNKSVKNNNFVTDILENQFYNKDNALTEYVSIDMIEFNDFDALSRFISGSI